MIGRQKRGLSVPLRSDAPGTKLYINHDLRGEAVARRERIKSSQPTKRTRSQSVGVSDTTALESTDPLIAPDGVTPIPGPEGGTEHYGEEIPPMIEPEVPQAPGMPPDPNSLLDLTSPEQPPTGY